MRVVFPRPESPTTITWVQAPLAKVGAREAGMLTQHVCCLEEGDMLPYPTGHMGAGRAAQVLVLVYCLWRDVP
jgi:hypothetical protein